VYPAAEIPLIAARRGVTYAIVNRGETDHDGSIHLTLRIEGNVSTIFPDAVDSALGHTA
jgi:NAD-dependent SIR2 family protein deacetylase